jgi:hypothetical protein
MSNAYVVVPYLLLHLNLKRSSGNLSHFQRHQAGFSCINIPLGAKGTRGVKLRGPFFLYSKIQRFHTPRETREGWPADCWSWGEWGLKEYKWKGFFLPCWVRCADTKDFCPAFAVVVGPVKNMFFSFRTLFQFFCPYRPAAGRQPCWVTCL